MLSARAAKLLEDTAQSVEQVHAGLSERAEVLAAVLAELRALGAPAELVEQWAAREAATTQALATAGLERAALAAARARQQK